MTKLDDLLSCSTEDYRTLTVRVSSDVAESLGVKAKKLGVSRSKLVQTVFEEGMEILGRKFNPASIGNMADTVPTPSRGPENIGGDE